MTDKKLVFLRRFGSTAVLWTVALWIILSGYEIGFFGLITTLAMIGLWEYYVMLDQKKLPNFKYIGMTCGLIFSIGSFYWISKVGPAKTYDFEVATLVFFLLVVFARQMFQKTRDISPIETMAYTLFGLFYVPWMFGFVTKIVYVVPRNPDGSVAGHFEGAAADVDALLDWCQSGPEYAQVDDVRVTEAEPAGNHGFDVRG